MPVLAICHGRSGQPEIPKAAFARFGLQPVHDFDHARRPVETITGAANLGMKFIVQRDDIGINHVADLFDQRSDAVGDAKIHGGLHSCGWVWS